MGNSNSSLPLHVQPTFPRVTNQRFIDHKRMVSLLMDDQFFLPTDSQGAPATEIRDADLDTVVFKIQRPSPNQRKLILMDSNGVATVALEGFMVQSQLAIYDATNPLTSVAKQKNEAPQLLVRMYTDFQPGGRTLFVELADGKGGHFRVHCRGRWQSHDAWLYIDRVKFNGKAPDVEYIVRVLPVKLTSNEKQQRKAKGIKSLPYKAIVAPGVDIGFVVLACAAMDMEVPKKDDKFVPTEEDKARAAERPTHMTLQTLNTTYSFM